MNILRRSFLQSLAAAPAVLHGQTTPEGLFTQPPHSAGVWIFWYWMNANVSREGITADLEAMHDNGIAGVYLFSIGANIPATKMDPPADPLTDYWWTFIRHAATEADRLGMKLCLNACDGWATAGGPWITPELSMQKLIWSETACDGGRPFDAPLPQPASLLNYYRDVAVLAFPIPDAWQRPADAPKQTTNLPSAPDGSIDTNQQGYIQFEYAQPFTCRSVTIHTPAFNRSANSLELQAGDDASNLHTVLKLTVPKNGWQTTASPWTHSIPETTARIFRFVHHPDPNVPYAEDNNFALDANLKLTRIELSSIPRINHLEGKSGATWTIGASTHDTAASVPLAAVKDLTSRMSAGGRLNWTPPPGRWTILRFGHTTTAAKCDPAGAGQGLECDKFNPDAARVQFNGWFGEAIRRIGPALSDRVLKVFHVDSWESYSQNWSPLFAGEFRRRRGYDLTPYLPAMAGYVLTSADVSERFLLDIRRTIAELLNNSFFEPMARMAHEKGCLFSAECTAPVMTGDGMLHYRTVDLPMGEFWLDSLMNDKPTDVRDAVSGAHVYGKPIVQAEAFTEGNMSWREHPFALKALGDRHYCAGFNRFVLHVYAHQAWPDRAPGVTLANVGTFFSRTQTWWKPGRVWFDYLRRCQTLLQQGRHVADVCYFTGENIPARAILPERLDPPLPPGYAYDSINRDALLTRASVRDGAIVLPGGASYRVLVIPPSERALTPEVARKLRDLVKAGATVIAPLPEVSPSLEHYPACDTEVREISREIAPSLHPGPLRQAINVPPDVEILSPASARIEWTHRTAPGLDLYFLSNQSPLPVETKVAFRVVSRIPELWDPDTASIKDAPVYTADNNRTAVTVNLDPAGSVFVVFRRAAPADPQAIDTVEPRLANLTLERTPTGYNAWAADSSQWTLRTRAGRTLFADPGNVAEPIDLDGPWRVAFGQRQIEFPLLRSWSEHPDSGVRFYSGTARYTLDFTLTPGALAGRRRISLDLGSVACLAVVRLNGRTLGTLWRPPFSLDVTAALKPGTNHLEIDVTNTWKNRLVGAATKADAATWLLFEQKVITAATPLDPAGLLGPVRLITAAPVQLTAAPPPSPYATPLKHPALVLTADTHPGAFDSRAVDCPFVFRHDGRFYMTYVAFDGTGYQTGLAESDDLISWRKRGAILRRDPASPVTRYNIAMNWILRDSQLRAPGELKKAGGRYLGVYHAYPNAGYEVGAAVIGLCWSADLLNWQIDPPSLIPSEGAEWERGGLYKPCIVEEKGTYYLFYNAKNQTAGGWHEQTGVATSTDLKTWTRSPANPVIRNGPEGSPDSHFASDPCVLLDGDRWVIFYFGLDGKGRARDLVATGDTPFRATKSHRILIDIGPPGSIDSTYAHKPSMIWHNGRLYHFYCAVSGRWPDETRGIAVARSES